MSVTVIPYTPPEETTLWIGSHRFLFTLHTLQQQLMMHAVHSAALQLTPAQVFNFEFGGVDANGFPLDTLRAFIIGYEQMDKLGGQIDLMSANLDTFLQAASLVGIYGATPQEIAAEIARVKSNTPPE